MFKKVVSVIGTAVFGLMISFSAAANKPSVVYEENSEGLTFSVFECDGFWIDVMLDVKVWETEFYDKNGNLVKDAYHQRISNAVYYNSENPEIMHEAKTDVAFSETSYKDGVAVEYRERGVFWHIQDGGEKIIFMSGLGIWNPDDGYFHHGLFIYPLDEETMARVCSFFAE